VRAVHPVKGQRWVSHSEPELGLGFVLRASVNRIEIFFPATGEIRAYALRQAPLRRIRLRENERLITRDGEVLIVREVVETDGLLTYRTGEEGDTDLRDVPEADLSDTMSFNAPVDRFLAARLDENALFDLRIRALRFWCNTQATPARGFAGARIDLIPHQLGIAMEVANRPRPRALLADEVGLGKTIEAALILHRLHITGRARRVLILVPEPLIHQWFVELLRRFQMRFDLFDEERCRSLDATMDNPFEDSQHVLTAIEWLSENPQRARQLQEAGWDLVIVDEAHHLIWEPEAASPSYRLVEKLAATAPGLLLLSATPQQLGPAGHFARLRLLDPERYSDLDAFLKEAKGYEKVAKAVDAALDGDFTRARTLAKRSPHLAESLALAEAAPPEESDAREELARRLVDMFGTGRIMFRHTRREMEGFPERHAHLVALPGDAPAALLDWLAGLLRELDEVEKVLLICRSPERAEALAEGLRERTAIPQACYHEDLTLLQRDRNAASFTTHDGARILFCSEIGSEGRNFQSAHHLVLVDLPEDPDLLQQRIGRLDRIGQTQDITIHIPFGEDPRNRDHVLARWFHEGLNAFEGSVHGGSELARTLAPDIRRALKSGKCEPLIKKSRTLHAKIESKLEKGYERLLRFALPRPGLIDRLRDAIVDADESPYFEPLFVALLDHLGARVEEISRKTWFFGLGDFALDALPDLAGDGLTATFDRTHAVAREDLNFLSIDHPLVGEVFDYLLSSETGNATFCLWHVEGEEPGFFLEAHYLVECVAPADLQIERFLPLTLVTQAVTHTLHPVPHPLPWRRARMRQGKARKTLASPKLRESVLPAMWEALQTQAREEVGALADEAAERAKSELDGELSRLRELAKVNPSVNAADIAAAESRAGKILDALTRTRIRLDSARLIQKT